MEDRTKKWYTVTYVYEVEAYDEGDACQRAIGDGDYIESDAEELDVTPEEDA